MCLDVCESISAFNVVFHGDIDGEMDTKKVVKLSHDM